MLEFEHFRFDPASRELVGAASTCRLSPKAAEVLLTLHEAEGRVCSRTDILDRVWPRAPVGEEVLTHAIAELRKAFGDDRRAPRYIETVHKHGYRLKAAAGPPARPLRADTRFDPETYCLSLEANDHFERGGRWNTNRAVELYSMVVERNSGSAAGHAGLAKTLAFSCVYYEPGDWKLERAEAHCGAALQAEPRSAEALAALGLLMSLRGDFRGGCGRFAQALSLAPQNPETHYLLGRSCFVAGEYNAAAAILERAASLRADDYHSPVIAGKLRLKLGDEASARANFVRGLGRAQAYIQSYPDSFRAVRFLADCLWHVGRRDEAMALVGRMLDHPDPMPYYTASFLALAGETDAALRILSEAVDAGWRHGSFLAHDGDLDPLRGEAGFKRIANSVGA